MRFFGESWLNHQFARKMSLFTHEQNQQIERLKLQVNTLFDRATKLHAREFDAVPEAWSLLVDADRHVRAIVTLSNPTPTSRDIRKTNWKSFWAIHRYLKLRKRASEIALIGRMLTSR